MNILLIGVIIAVIVGIMGLCVFLYKKGLNKKKLTAIGTGLILILASIPIILNDNPPALGKTRYVSVTGSDSNDGTTPYNDHAFRTPQKAFNVTASGDTVKICPGTYVIRGGAGHSTYGSYVFWNRAGTGGNWFIIRDNGNGTVIFDGTTCPSGEYNAILRFYDPRYIRITGITFNHSYRNALTFQRDSLYYPSFITIDNCSITNCSQAMIYIVSGNNVTIENNYVYNNFNNWTGTLSPKISGEVISLPNAADYDINNNTMMNNRFINIDLKGTVRRANVCYNRINTTAFDYVIDYWGIKSWGESAIYIDTQGANAYNITIHHNFIYGNCTGININNEGATGHYEYVYIHDNIINVTRTPFSNQGYYTTRCPVYLGNEGASLATMYHDIFIYSNTLCTGNDSPEDDNFPCILFGRRPGGATLAEFTSANLDDVVVVNNVLYTADSSNTSTGYLLMSVRNITWAEAANIFTVNNNSFYRMTNSINIWWGSTKYYYPTYATYFGGEATFTDPAFVTRAEQYADFHLTSVSPCVDSGNDTYYSAIDFDGVERPFGPGVDIGGYEFYGMYSTTIRKQGLDYFVWLGANTTAYWVNKTIVGMNSATESISIWNRTTWSNGLWQTYNGTRTGINWTVHTFQIIRTKLADAVGNQTITMTENSDMDYSGSHSIVLVNQTKNKGYNFSAYNRVAATTLQAINTTGIVLPSGDMVARWNRTGFKWDIWISGFGPHDHAVSRWDVIQTKITGPTKTWTT